MSAGTHTICVRANGTFAIQAGGLVTIPRTPNVTCPPNASQTQAGPATIGPDGALVQNAVRVEVLGLLGIVTQQVILSSCYIN